MRKYMYRASLIVSFKYCSQAVVIAFLHYLSIVFVVYDVKNPLKVYTYRVNILHFIVAIML